MSTQRGGVRVPPFCDLKEGWINCAQVKMRIQRRNGDEEGVPEKKEGMEEGEKKRKHGGCNRRPLIGFQPLSPEITTQRLY
ncbi:hypothetical protein LEMLEM_LOCUS16724 [Lemmus lemmus]